MNIRSRRPSSSYVSVPTPVLEVEKEVKVEKKIEEKKNQKSEAKVSEDK